MVEQTEVLESNSSSDDSDSVHKIGVGIPDEPTYDVSKEATQTVVLELDSSSHDSDSVHDIGVEIDLEVSQAASRSGSVSSVSSFSSVPIDVSPSPKQTARSGASIQQTGVDSEND